MSYVRDQWTRPQKQPDGSVERVPNARHGTGKRWLACWNDQEGREQSQAFRVKAAAERHARNMETDRDRGDYIDPKAGRARFAEVGRRWLDSRMVDPSSALRYESAYRLHVEPAFGRRQVRAIKPSEIQAWLAELDQRHGPSTGRTAFLVVQGVLDLAVADDSLKKNPAKSPVVHRPVARGETVQAWTDATVGAVLDGHPAMFQAIPMLGAACGLRQGELFGLALEDFDFDEQVLRVRRQVKRLGSRDAFALPKSDRERTVPLPAWAAQAVHRHVAAYPARAYSLPWEKPDGPLRTVHLLFRWADDRHIRARSYDETVWKPALVEAGALPKPVTDTRGRKRYVTDRKAGMHALRHYYASVTLADGVNIRELAEYLGHHDPGFTLRTYAHMMPSSHERARQAIDARMFRPRAVADGAYTEQREVDQGM